MIVKEQHIVHLIENFQLLCFHIKEDNSTEIS